MLWSEKHSPKNIDEVIGNPDALEKIKVWALEWSRGARKPPIFIYGPPGIGKTCLARALASTYGWEYLEINASDVSDKEKIEQILSAAGESSTLSGALKLIFIDEVDGAPGRGVVPAIYDAAKNTRQPMMIAANDAWEQSISSLKTVCMQIELKRVNVRSIASRLKKIAGAENLGINEEQAEAVADNSGGDLRAAINDLQSLAWLDEGGLMEREREKNTYDCVRRVLKAKTYDEAKGATRGVDLEPEMLARWIDENVPREYETPGDIARAFNSLSRADVFYGRIRNRQYWGFLRYFSDLVTAGVALAKEEPYHKFARYDFPNYIRKMGATKSRRAKEKKILEKIGAKTHSSNRRARSALGMVKLMMKNGESEESVARYFLFDEEDVAFLTGKKKAATQEKENGLPAPKKRAKKK
ncbi:MAG: replication factor C large subunit [Candidatus Micrarchaeota archaeon]